MITFNTKVSREAQGLEKAPVVLKGASVLNVFTEEWDVADIAIHDDTIIGVGTYSGETEYDYSGKYIVPGFIDSHLHLESTLVNPKELVFEASQVGTLGFIVDPHEAGNVAGIAGIEYMINETASAQGDVYVMAPSCVPAVPGEDNGAILDGDMLHKLQSNPRILGLGEVMDSFGVIDRDPYMVKKLDAGDMISKVEVDILDSDNYESLHDKLSIAGRDLLKETLPNIFTGNIAPEKQDDSLATFARNILREDEKIDWNKSAGQIFNQIRALDPTPGAFTYLDENILKIWNSEVVELEENYSAEKAGTIIKQDKKYIYVLCGKNTVLKVKELQISGKKRMPVVNFLSNKKDYVGTILGGINE